MKLRQGFVSNSSTTSFSVYGVCVDEELAKKIVEQGLTDLDVDGSNPTDALSDFLYYEEDKRDISIHWGEDWGGPRTFYIGRDPGCCPDDMTMGDFKKQIQNTIKDVLKVDDLSFGFHEESYRDG